MAVNRYTFDTNILFYALDAAAGEKHRLARNLIAAADPDKTPLLLQTLAELCNAILRRRSDLVHEAERFVENSTEIFTLIAAHPSDVHEALWATRDHNLQFWDAMVWSMARRANCRVLLTEDMQDGRSLGGVTFRNPFTMDPADLADYLLP